MKKNVSLFVLIVFLLSCSKDKKDSPEFYFRFKANGIQREYLVTGSYFYNERNCLLGAKLDSTNKYSIAVVLESTAKIKADSTYIEVEALPYTAPYSTRYYIRMSENYPAYNYGSWVSLGGKTYLYPCTVTILEIDDKHVKGRVSGKVSNDFQTDFITITDGEFNVKRE